MFYAKLAWSNIKKSINVFGPFLLSSTILFVLNCSTLLILFSPVGGGMRHGASILSLALIVLAIFSAVMEIYSYQFLLKQRSKEFGLYNMLGMNRWQVSWLSTIELGLILLGVIVLGSVLSAIFSQLFYLAFVNLLHYHQMVLTLSLEAFVSAIVLFIGMFVLLEGVNLYTIRRTSPLALFKKQEQGEKEPRGNVLLAILSVLSLGIGYYLSLSSTKVAALVVLYRFFAAVVLVIIGTYLFYISFMTWYLKRRRQNKAYFYKPEHFVTTAQMIFRMKQNAVGLANITLLAVMAFVTIATTTSLYVNTQTQVNMMFPKTTKVALNADNQADMDTLMEKEVMEPLHKPADQWLTYRSVYTLFPVSDAKEIAMTREDVENPNLISAGYLYIVTQDDFRALGNKLSHLNENQTAFFTQKDNSHLEKLDLFGQTFDNVHNLKEVNFPEVANTYNPAVLVVSNQEVLNNIETIFTKNKVFHQTSLISYADLSQKEIKSLAHFGGESEVVHEDANGNSISATVETKQEYLDSAYAFTGGFLFTDFLLGISFLMGAALIIYYKQRSEGIEDKKSYKILQEVGMNSQEVKKAINSQILLVFFMPLGLATLHFAVALVMLKQMLLIFGVTSSSTIYIVSGSTIVILTLVYFMIYKITSQTYYKIIDR